MKIKPLLLLYSILFIVNCKNEVPVSAGKVKETINSKDTLPKQKELSLEEKGEIERRRYYRKYGSNRKERNKTFPSSQSKTFQFFENETPRGKPARYHDKRSRYREAWLANLLSDWKEFQLARIFSLFFFD